MCITWNNTYLVYLGVSNVIHAWELSSDHPILNLQVLFSNSVLSGARWVQMSPNAAKVFEWPLSLKSRFAGCPMNLRSDSYAKVQWISTLVSCPWSFTSPDHVDLFSTMGWSTGSDKQTQSDHLECLDGRWYHGQWGYEHQLLNYWWNRVKKVNWCKLIPRPCRAYSHTFFLADLPVWWVLPKPESCRNSARILANGVTKV